MVTPGPVTYLFGPYRLDTVRRVLYAGSMPTPIPERLFQILVALIQAGGHLVDRETLAQQVWGDVGVTDTNVNQHIYLLRLLLGERKNERSYIITVPGEGYRFASPVTVAPDGEYEFVADSTRSGERVLDVGSEIFQAFCRGSYLLDVRTAAGLEAAADAFEEALSIDPDYVPALIGFARASALLAEYWHVPAATAFPKAKAAIQRALRSEPRSSMAHAVLSELQLFGDWDWTRAKRSIVAAITLNPQSTFARNNAAWYYICRGELEKALVEARQALIVEPASLPLQLLQARVLVHTGSYRSAIAGMSNILATDPNYYLARRYRAQAFVLDDQPEAALEDLFAVDADPVEDASFRLPLLGRTYAMLGDMRRATEVYDRLRGRLSSEYVAWWNLAIVAAGIHRNEEALRFLQNALADREPTLLFLRTLPWFESLENRPEFKKILREVGP
jgi:DNA-binding winged helix-turn-helix (wHTH) protein/tetratricopeptide (TPR) repeat protein